MAETKNKKTTKVTETKDVELNNNELMKLIQSMSTTLEELRASNAMLTNELNEQKKKLQEVENNSDGVEIVKAIEPSYLDVYHDSRDTLPKKVVVVHLQELLGGTSTYIKLSNTVRTLHHMGEIATFDLDSFEELASKYRHFFDNGVLAVDSKYIDIAEMYQLPVFNAKNKAIYSKEMLNKLPNVSLQEIEKIYNELAPSSRDSFLSYWLTQCYEKNPGFYDREKMAFLNKISDTETFLTLMKEMDNNDYRAKSKNEVSTEIII